MHVKIKFKDKQDKPLFSCTHSHCLFTRHLLQFILFITLSNNKNFVSGFVSDFVSGFVSSRAFLTLPTSYKQKYDKHVNQVDEHHSESETETLFKVCSFESKPEHLNENVVVWFKY